MHLLMSSSVTRFGEIPHFGQYLKIFGNILKVYLVLGKVFSSLSYNLYAFGQIFNAENSHILLTQSGCLVTQVVVWSHWLFSGHTGCCLVTLVVVWSHWLFSGHTGCWVVVVLS